MNHSGQEALSFINTFFGDAKRKILLIAGAGFDPRSTSICKAMSDTAKARISGAFIREERPDPSPELLRRAMENLSKLQSLVINSQELRIDVFAADGAVVGGRSIVLEL